MKLAFLNATGPDGYTALMWAAMLIRVPMMRFLVHHGAHVDAMNNYRETALVFAITSRSAEAVKCLVELNADVNTIDIHGMTPLLLALKCRSGDEIVRCLVQHGASVNVGDPDGYLPVHYATVLEAHDSLDCLAAAGAHMDGIDNKGRSAMHLAAKANDGEGVGKLHQLGASVNLQDYCLRTPLLFAAKELHQVAAQELLTLKADPNIAECIDRTPLHLAASFFPLNDRGRCRCMEMVQLLHRHNADLNAVNFYDETPLDEVHKLKGFDIWDYLHAHGAKPGTRGYRSQPSIDPSPADIPNRDIQDSDISDEDDSDEVDSDMEEGFPQRFM